MAEESNSDRVIWFLAGAAVGVAIGMLFAPKSGREIRQYIGEKTADGRDLLVETGRDVYAKGRDLYEQGKGLAEDAGELFERGRKAVKI